MDHHSIVNQNSESVQGDTPITGARQSAPASVSAGIAAANAHLPSLEIEPRFPGEDGGQSLAKMAQIDLDAALQLLAERAQYITGASGAAIALRRGEHADMLCRASAGSNAPELGALLSMEYGLSGESVRTRQALRCNDTEVDPRVNREGCRQLGIASVVVMPIVSEQQVIGVFELFSGQPRAFEERDLSALQRLSEMVETAVRHAVAAQSMPAIPAIQEPGGAEVQLSEDVIVAESLPVESAGTVPGADLAPLPPEAEKTVQEKAEPGPAPKNPLFWSAAMQISAGIAGHADAIAESIPVPAELRNLQKCKACGFPVSQGRIFCVECEEKQWRGQRLPQPAASANLMAHAQPQQEPQAMQAMGNSLDVSVSKDNSSMQTPGVQTAALEDVSSSDISPLSLSSAAPSESWFAANKYMLAALAVAIVIAAIVWLR